MSQILTRIEGILKDKYQPALANLINIEPSPFLEMIRKEPLTNNKVRLAAPIGINGGFGFGAEGESTPDAGEQNYVDFELNAVDMYVDINISNKTIALGSSNQSSMINALDTEIKGSYAAAKWNLARSLFGDGSGILTYFDAKDTTTDTITVTTTAPFIEGLRVDVYTNYREKIAARARIKRVDHMLKSITLDTAVNLSEGGFLTVQNSYHRELCGLGAIFNSSVETLYGVSRNDNPWLSPHVIPLEGNVTDMGLYRGIRVAKRQHGTSIDLIMMGDVAFEAYQNYMDQHTTHLVDRHKFVGGSTGYSILVGDREVIIVNEGMIPECEAWGVDTKTFILQQTPWEFVSQKGSIFTLQANTSVYRALLASYGNLICSNPGGCVRFIDCAPPPGTVM